MGKNFGFALNEAGVGGITEEVPMIISWFFVCTGSRESLLVFDIG